MSSLLVNSSSVLTFATLRRGMGQNTVGRAVCSSHRSSKTKTTIPVEGEMITVTVLNTVHAFPPFSRLTLVLLLSLNCSHSVKLCDRYRFAPCAVYFSLWHCTVELLRGNKVHVQQCSLKQRGTWNIQEPLYLQTKESKDNRFKLLLLNKSMENKEKWISESLSPKNLIAWNVMAEEILWGSSLTTLKLCVTCLSSSTSDLVRFKQNWAHNADLTNDDLLTEKV